MRAVDFNPLEAPLEPADTSQAEPFVPPRGPVEEALAKILCDILRLERVGAHDNFFDLGGRSLSAPRMIARVRAAFGIDLPLVAFFEAPTVAEFALHIENLRSGAAAPAKTSPCLVPIRPRGSKPAFFCVHELFGDVTLYSDLSRHFGDDRPFYALQARGLEAGEEPFTSMDDMVIRYAEEIRAVQPHGPYHLGGLCSGGIVAFEIARHMQAAGHDVGLVAMFDVPDIGPRSQEYGRTSVRDVMRRLPDWLRSVFELSREQWRGFLGLKMAIARRTLEGRLRRVGGLLRRDRTRAGSEGAAGLDLIETIADFFDFSADHRRVAAAQYAALGTYVPGVYAGRITLFRAQMQPLFKAPAPDNGWARLAAGGVDVRFVPGNHLAMLQEPHVRILARELRACLEQVTQASDASRPAHVGHADRV